MTQSRGVELVLAIETSCDDTSVSIVGCDGKVLSLVSASQDSEHKPYGGIVPEIASRNHSVNMLPLVETCLKKAGLDLSQVGGVVVTNRPGLVGSLIVGLVTAKTLAQTLAIPILGVNHLEGHLLAPFLRDDSYAPPESFSYPFIALAISGGHTSLYFVEDLGVYKILGATLDDAAGEAFDKFAKMIGLGFPGGVQVDQLAKSGDPTKFHFPRAMIKEENYLFSFSGLKASAQRMLEGWSEEEIVKNRSDLCASYQEAICEALIAKLDRAVANYKLKRVIITGGVSANSRLRKLGEDWASRNGIQLVIPPIRYCTDNAAMIGYAGILRLNRGERSELDLAPSPSSWAGDFK